MAANEFTLSSVLLFSACSNSSISPSVLSTNDVIALIFSTGKNHTLKVNFMNKRYKCRVLIITTIRLGRRDDLPWHPTVSPPIFSIFYLSNNTCNAGSRYVLNVVYKSHFGPSTFSLSKSYSRNKITSHSFISNHMINK